MKDKLINWLKSVGIKTVKTMAETAIAVIGTNAMGITDVDWLGAVGIRSRGIRNAADHQRGCRYRNDDRTGYRFFVGSVGYVARSDQDR